MILVWLIAIPIVGGLAAWTAGKAHEQASKWVALFTMVAEFALAVLLWVRYYQAATTSEAGVWLIQWAVPWIPAYGISVRLALDGMSLLLVVLTAFVGLLSVAVSWSGITRRVPFYFFNLLWILGGVVGVFLALDLFLFYVFWEMMLIPMYFLVGIWGHENRVYAAIKFFIFTQASGLLMLLAILGLAFAYDAQTGTFSFNYADLLEAQVSGAYGMWLMLGFFVAFAVKLPAFPFHPWLADAHTEAPTAGSVILAGLMLKTGAYGLIRFVVPLFPEAAVTFAPWAMTLGVIGILYGAVLALGQRDLKRLVAYTSVSHLGFVLMGIFAFNELALQGALLEMICHGLSTPALFIVVGILQEHLHTRDMERMGGLWASVPRMGGIAMFFAVASLGLPGLGNFIGEFFVLVGTFRVNAPAAVLGSLGLVGAAIYSLWIIQRAFHGEPRERWTLPDLNVRGMLVFAPMVVVLVWLGVYPQPVLQTTATTLRGIRDAVTGTVQYDPLNHRAVLPAEEAAVDTVAGEEGR